MSNYQQPDFSSSASVPVPPPVDAPTPLRQPGDAKTLRSSKLPLVALLVTLSVDAGPSIISSIVRWVTFATAPDLPASSTGMISTVVWYTVFFVWLLAAIIVTIVAQRAAGFAAVKFVWIALGVLVLLTAILQGVNILGPFLIA